MWINNEEILSKYDYIIHFEPRQLLIDNYFIDNFIKNPRALFTYNHHPCNQKHFNTGLFACKSNELLEFINKYSPELLVTRSLGLEHALYQFYETNKIQYDTLDKMSLIWYDTAAKKKWIW
jgi:mannose-1-phosphate guanylyltransferase